MPDEKNPTATDVEEFLIKGIASGLDSRIGIGRHGLVKEVTQRYPSEPKPSPTQITEAAWGLVARGLAYIDFSMDTGQSGGNYADPASWWLFLTARGRAYAADELPNPDIPDKYLQRIVQSVPVLSEVVKLYLREALETYRSQNYIASSVMLGVAAEAAFLEMAEAFANYLSGAERDKFRKMLDDPRVSYNKVFEDFRERTSQRKKVLGKLGDNLDIQLHSTLDMIRNYRNDAGHPSGLSMNRADCFVNLVAFARAAERLYGLKAFFEEPPTSKP